MNSRVAWIASLLLVTACLTPALLRADDAKPAKNLLKPTNKPDSWRLEQHDAAKGKMSVDGDAILFEVTDIDGQEWHVQAVQTGFDLKDAKEYVLTFKAKASADRNLSLNAMIDQDDWHNVGLAEQAELTKDWKDFKFEFKADQAAKDNKNRITFILGGEKGKVWLKEISLTEK